VGGLAEIETNATELVSLVAALGELR
jgi:hypothetical protein